MPKTGSTPEGSPQIIHVRVKSIGLADQLAGEEALASLFPGYNAETTASDPNFTYDFLLADRLSLPETPEGDLGHAVTRALELGVLDFETDDPSEGGSVSPRDFALFCVGVNALARALQYKNTGSIDS